MKSARKFSGAAKVTLLNTAMMAAGGAICALALKQIPALPAPRTIPLWALAASFALAEAFVIHLEVGKSAHTVSLSEMSLIIGLFFVDPVTLVAAQALGAAVTLKFYRKQSTLRLVFNLSQLLLSTSIAAWAFHAAVGSHDPLGPAGWAGAFLAAFISAFVSALAIEGAISLSERRAFENPLAIDVSTGFVFATTCLAVLAATVLWERPMVAWVIPVLASSLFVGYRSYESLKRKHETLGTLYETTELDESDSRVELIVTRMMTQARKMFRAEFAEIIRFSSNSRETAVMYSLGADGSPALFQKVQLHPQEGVWARVASENAGVLLARPIDNPSLKAYYADKGVADAMVAPLRRGGEVVGTFLVGNRLGDFKTFDDDDLRMLETLANHASVALDNGRLVDSLRQEAEKNHYQALHDELTDLPNRTLFYERISQAIRQADMKNLKVAVMLIDLDHFKDVNDTLGHHNGDLLLQEVGKRLRRALRGSDTVARLGGDEFAILLPEVPNEQAAIEAASQLLDILNRPLELGEVTVDVRGSIGIALSPDHAHDPGTLLQRADVAMYLAKSAGGGHEMYSPERDQYSPDKLALVAELRHAIEDQTLAVHYQPQVEIRTGRVTGVEALVRWFHPRNGFIPPDQFIPMAEQTGLIRPLTLYVLNTALTDLAGWIEQGFRLRVAVNLSARNLSDVELPGDISAMVASSHDEITTSLIQLEITESSIMGDAARALEHLEALHTMGIPLSVDDYGTGYSSLSYLKRLPVEELKIDKSFVIGMGEDQSDEVIVRSTIDLAHNLGLQVVAEGVEDEGVLSRLRSLGCDIAQGYHLARPMPNDKLLDWLDQNYGERTPLNTNPSSSAMPPPPPARKADAGGSDPLIQR